MPTERLVVDPGHDSNLPRITQAQRRDILARRIVGLEADLYNYMVTRAEMEAVLADMPGQTDAEDELHRVQLSITATEARLKVLRDMYRAEFVELTSASE